MRRTWLLFVLLLFSANARAFEATGGLSVLEEGDDRYRRGINLGLEFRNVMGTVYYFTRSFGPVIEQEYLVTAGYYFGIPYFRSLFYGVGLSGTSERITIRYSKAAEKAFNVDDTHYNFGVFLGLKWKYPFGKRYDFIASWDAAVFPAGLQVILLSTGRKQIFSVGIGARL